MNSTVYSSVDEYMSTVQPERFRVALEALRRVIQEEIPDAVECISYGMPGYKRNGYLCGFAAFKNHCSFFPGGIALDFAEELSAFKTSKGTIQFTPEIPIPDDLLRRIIRACVERDQARKMAKSR